MQTRIVPYVWCWRRGVGGALGSALLIRSHASAALRSHTLRHNRLDSTLNVFQQVHTKFPSRYLHLRIILIRVPFVIPYIFCYLNICIYVLFCWTSVHNNFNGNRVHTVFPNQSIIRKKGSCNETKYSILFLGYYKLTVAKKGWNRSKSYNRYLFARDWRH